MGAKPTNKIEMTHAQLSELLLPVLPHTDQSRFSYTPALEHVHLQTRGEHLTATATDKYTLAIARVPTRKGAKVDAMLHQRDAKALLALFKPARRTAEVDLPLTLTFTKGGLRVEGTSAKFPSAVVTYELGWAHEFPPIRPIVQDRLGVKGDGEPFALNPVLLAKFAVASKALGGLPLQVHSTSTNHPTLVTIADSFIGVIMPVRSAGEDDTDWAAFLPAPKAGAR